MTGGPDLLGAPIAAPRKRGRPKGSTNKRAKDLRGIIDAKYGGSAALQAAQLCMVTPAELKAAGGSMAKAQVNKALDLVAHVRQAQDSRDEALRAIVREELETVALHLGEDGAKLKRLVAGALGKVREAASGFGLREALDLLTKERGNLLPYTDQRQPLAIDMTGKGMAPSVVVMGVSGPGQAPGLGSAPIENVEVFDSPFTVVSQAVSHDEVQALEPQGLLPLGAAD